MQGTNRGEDGEKSLLCDPPHLSYDYEGEKRRAKIINGMGKKRKKKLGSGSCCRGGRPYVLHNLAHASRVGCVLYISCPTSQNGRIGS